MDKWQRIETAPRDGTYFIARVRSLPPDLRVMVGKFSQGNIFSSHPGRWNYEPTHWMPLPAPPEDDSQ